MDVLLTRDRDLLRLVFEVLDVVVDVEDVFVQLGKVVELRREEDGSVLMQLQCAKKLCSVARRCRVSVRSSPPS